MRILEVYFSAALLVAVGAQVAMADQLRCAVYSYSGKKVADKRHGRLILAASRPSPEDALRIGLGMAVRMTEIVGVDFIEVYVNQPEDAASLLIPGQGDPAQTAIAVVQHNPGASPEMASRWEALITERAPRDTAVRRDRRGRRTVLDEDQVRTWLTEQPLSDTAQRTLCGLG